VFYVVFQSIIKVFVFGETNKYSSKTTVEQVNLSDYRKTLGNDVSCQKFQEEKRVQVGVEMDEYPEEEYKPARDSEVPVEQPHTTLRTGVS
jgi:hypothetical protein